METILDLRFINSLKNGIEKNVEEDRCGKSNAQTNQKSKEDLNIVVDKPNYRISKSAKYSEFYEDSQKWYLQDC